MRRLLFAVCIACIAGRSFSQAGDRYVDSLLQLAAQYPAPDTHRLTLLLNISDAIVFRNSDSSMQLANEVIATSPGLSWEKGIALGYRQKGTVYYVLSDNLNAMEYYQKALKAGEFMHNQVFNASLYNNLANIYSDQKQYQKGLEYYQRFYENAREARLVKEQTIALINIGTVNTELNAYSEALNNFRKSLELAEQANNGKLIPMILANIGFTLDKKGEDKAALDYFQQSVQRADKTGSENAKAPALLGMSKIFLRQNNLPLAEQYARQSLILAEKLGSSEWQSNAWQTLSDIYAKQRKPDQAFNAYKQYIVFRDSVSNEEKKSELTRKELAFDYEKKTALVKAEQEKMETLAAAALNRQRLIRNTILSGGFVLLLVSLFSFNLYKKKRDAEERRKEAEFNAMAAETEMKTLRLQMNPHFIFNSLNSIGDFISKHDTKSADDYLAKFSKVMRMTLEHSDQKEISLAEDLKMLDLYLQLESRRLDHSFTYSIQVDAGIDSENTLVPPMMLQPFVENSIWHGISNKNGHGKVEVRVAKDDGMIHFIVEDNGVGRRPSEGLSAGQLVKHTKSFGIRITKARMDILNREKNSAGGIVLSDMEKGTRVDIKLPYITQLD